VVDCFFNPDGDADFSSVKAAHSALIDQVVEVDEDLMALYLEQGEDLNPSSCTRRSRRRCARAT
jgi:elongation factor G